MKIVVWELERGKLDFWKFFVLIVNYFNMRNYFYFKILFFKDYKVIINF